MKIAQIVEIILELPFEIESEEVAKEFVIEIKNDWAGKLPEGNSFTLAGLFLGLTLD